jgi:cytochrome c-type biogenesis protein
MEKGDIYLENISVSFAFVAGFLSFFSPCVIPLLPAYIANLTGGKIDHDKINVSRGLLLFRSLGFILGFSVLFTFMGASASLIGQFLIEYRDYIEKIGGFVIVVFGLQMAGIFNFSFLYYQKQWDFQYRQHKNFLSSFLLGISFGAGWTPCVGVALSSILLLAGAADTVYNGILFLLVYSAGLGIPFLIISLVLTYSLAIIKRINGLLDKLILFNAGLLICLGLLLMSGRFQEASAWFSSFTF